LLRVLIFISLLSVTLLCQANSQEIKVGVLAFRGNEKALQRWQPTFDYLEAAIPGTHFVILPLTLSELDHAVMRQSLDFVITNPGQYVRIGTKYGMSWLTTLKSRRHNSSKRVIGSALVIKTDSPYKELHDLKGENIGAVDVLAFGGFQVYWGEMAKQKIDPTHFFHKINFSHYPVDALVYWVRDRNVAAAIVPACLLEKMHEEGLINISNYRVLDLKQHDGFNCQSSSQLYPNWSFAKLKDTPTKLAEKISKALLSMDADSQAATASGSLGWTTPVSTYEIHKLYQRLDIHPWREIWWQQAWQWVRVNWQWGGLFLFVIILGFLHHLWVQLLVNRRTHELQQVNIELHQQQQELEHAQRIAILGELSSDLAHELNQPLAAINSFAEGGMIRLKNRQDNDNLIKLLSKISLEAQRSGKILQRIRGFAKKQRPEKQATNVSQLINDSVLLIQFELKKSGTNLALSLPRDKIIINIDPIEIQQVLINLIRNSIEAMSTMEGTHELAVEVFLSNDKDVHFIITDNGPGISQSMLDQIFAPFISTKKEGLGLGISICKRIIEAHHGTIRVENNPSGGCVVSFTLPGDLNE